MYREYIIIGKKLREISAWNTRILILPVQLINKGLIYATGHAETDFTAPQFDGFLKCIIPELEL